MNVKIVSGSASSSDISVVGHLCPFQATQSFWLKHVLCNPLSTYSWNLFLTPLYKISNSLAKLLLIHHPKSQEEKQSKEASTWAHFAACQHR